MKCTLLVAALGLLVACGAQLVSSNSYAPGGYADAAGHAAPGERPRVNLGISLKVPAMKINLGRMNMPKISIRAKIKQSHHPKVINVPEMHIDTQSKIPGPQGAQSAGHAGGQYGADASYGQPAPSYGQQASSYGQPASSYEQAAPSAYGPQQQQQQQPSYGAAQQDYGQQLAAGAYEQPAGGYQQPSAGYDSMPGSYDQADLAAYNAAVAQASAYDSAGSSYAPQQQQQQQHAGPAYAQQAASGYGQQAPSGYNQQASAASYGQQPAGYSQQPAPTNYGRKPYGAESSPASAAQLGGYGAASPSTYGPVRAAGNTRSQYGSSANAYASAQQQPQQYMQAAPARGYQAGPKPSYSGQQQAAGYAQPSQPQYAAAKPAASYQPQQAPAGYSSPAVPSYEPIGYQPLEPGHTLITATNDNYDGMTQMAVASNPAKDTPQYGGSSYGAPQGVSYGSSSSSSSYAGSSAPSYSAPGNSYGANQSSGAYSSSSSLYNSNPNQNAYSANSNNHASQPVYDDAASYGAADQGNYGARMNGPAAHQQQNGYPAEAY